MELLGQCEKTKDINQITTWIANKFHLISQALTYLHTNQIFHFDIKPSNILIDGSDKPILSDLGFAKRKTDDDSPIVVGFTIFYAHPDLKHHYTHMSSKNRVRKQISPKDFTPSWDIYAFGKSLMEILALVDQQFPDVVLYDYTFTYLHLAASRMLDGRNLTNEEIDNIRNKLKKEGEDLSVYKETWLELDAHELEEIKYSCFDQITKDFEKLHSMEHLLNSVPELSEFHTKRVQSSDGIPAPFSYRVKSLIEHPVYNRLKYVPQLGLLNEVYPTATHSRLEHSLGVFRNCCLYVNSLYNDIFNPLFKQLVNDKDIKAVLLASLLHDLGQYPLAHELEEIDKELKHEKLTLRLLNDKTSDSNSNTIKDIVENEEWGWGVDLESVKKILTGQKTEHALFNDKPLKVRMLSSIIDGPIDVDKLDYLLRDSQNCYLKYGDLIDIDRLLRNLTIIIVKNGNPKINFVVGTYEKGQTAAESLTFARYLLYQSLYWHHTARSIRAMLRESLIPALHKKKGKSSFMKDFEKIMGFDTTVKNVTINDILDLIFKWTDEPGQEMVKMVMNRLFYKRILTIHYDKSEEEGKPSFVDRFRNVYKKSDFSKRLQTKIREKYIDFLAHTTLPKVSLLSPEITEKTSESLFEPGKIICDVPPPNYGISDQNLLRFIPEPQRLQNNYYSRINVGDRVSEVWNQVYFKLMNIVSKGRVFCHPELRDCLMATIGPQIVRETLESVIDEFS